ncbi:MAG: phytanoyl-CoA dioxygenase family protein, partial [Alphaproteobacteria bacterium]|nr:phytanoyl-CoA dioxygenase family protein [Alphaproteobacteria bacterium]
MKLEHFSPETPVVEIANAIRRDGACIVDQVISRDEMDAVAADLKPWIDATPFGPDEFSGRKTKRTGGLVARSPKCRELVMNPLILGVTADLLG